MGHFLGFLSSAEIVAVVIVVLLVFGGTQIPKLARSLGRAQREFTTGLAEGAKETDKSGDGASRASDGDKSGGSTSSKNGAA